MSNFQEIVLKHLQDHQPDDYAELMRTRGLLAHMNGLVELLYEETERIEKRLEKSDPDSSASMRRLEAERIAIETLLTTSPTIEN